MKGRRKRSLEHSDNDEDSSHLQRKKRMGELETIRGECLGHSTSELAEWS